MYQAFINFVCFLTKIRKYFWNILILYFKVKPIYKVYNYFCQLIDSIYLCLNYMNIETTVGIIVIYQYNMSYDTRSPLFWVDFLFTTVN